jgi:hypothetical protein
MLTSHAFRSDECDPHSRTLVLLKPCIYTARGNGSPVTKATARSSR